MKALPAILFALAITGMIAIAMVLIGGNALLNTNTVPAASAASSTSAGTVQNASVSATSLQSADMQALIQQYQAREKQYQSQLSEAAKRLSDANTQLAQANQQIQQAGQELQQANQAVSTYQQVLVQLQRSGLITIDSSGQIFIRRSSNFN